MTDREKHLVAILLDIASNEFSNHGCNDMPENSFLNWTIEEKQALVKELYDFNGNPQDYDPHDLHMLNEDSILMEFFASKLISE